MKKIVLFGSAVLIIVLVVFGLRTETITEQSCQKTYGIVTEVSEGGVKDATFKLSGNETIFYINRAFENKFTLHQLRNEILNKKATIYFVKNSSLLSSNPKSQHIRKMKIGNRIFYSEF